MLLTVRTLRSTSAAVLVSLLAVAQTGPQVSQASSPDTQAAAASESNQAKAHVAADQKQNVCAEDTLATTPTTDNRITVTAPKVFDNRTLQLMLEGMGDSLRTLQVVDAASIKAAASSVQGYTQSDRGIAVVPQFSPTVTRSPESESQPVAQTDRPLSIPWEKDFIASAEYKPPIGFSPSDLLSDQVNLTYQILNLRLVLDRSISDRLKNGQPRLQAVIGVDVSLTPSEKEKDAAAVVEISFDYVGSTQRPALVAIMPREKTYNSAAITNRNYAFGGTALMPVATISGSWFQRKQTYFLHRDNDTVAFVRPAQKDDENLTVGWEFRPVLGRRSVTAGSRQLFAVLALPHADDYKKLESALLNVRVVTKWVKYRSDLATTGQDLKTPTSNQGPFSVCVPSTSFVHENLRPIVQKVSWERTSDEQALISIEGLNFFPGTSIRLGPQTHSDPTSGLRIKSDQAMELTVPLRSVGPHVGYISGRYGPATPLEAQDLPKLGGVRIHKAIISGPAGGAYVLDAALGALAAPANSEKSAWEDFTLEELNKLPGLRLVLNGTDLQSPYSIYERPCREPLRAREKDATLEAKGQSTEADNKDANSAQKKAERGWQCVFVRALVPAKPAAKAEGILELMFPFSGPEWTDRLLVYDDAGIYTITRLGKSENKATTPDAPPRCGETTLLISATRPQFEDGTWAAILDRTYSLARPAASESTDTRDIAPRVEPITPILAKQVNVRQKTAPSVAAIKPPACIPAPGKLTQIDNTMLRLDVPNEVASAYKRLLLRKENADAVELEIPEEKPAPKKPSLKDPAKVYRVAMFDTTKIEIEGTNLDTIKRVLVGDNSLEFKAAAAKLEAFLTQEVTSKPSQADLQLRTEGNADILTVRFVVEPRPELLKILNTPTPGVAKP